MLLYRKVGVIKGKGINQWFVNFEHEGKLRYFYINTGKPFLGPDKLPIVYNNRRALVGGDRDSPGKYSFDSVHLDSRYDKWVRSTLSVADLRQSDLPPALPTSSKYTLQKAYLSVGGSNGYSKLAKNDY